MFNMYGRFDMRAMSGVTWKPLSEESSIANSPSQEQYRTSKKPEIVKLGENKLKGEPMNNIVSNKKYFQELLEFEARYMLDVFKERTPFETKQSFHVKEHLFQYNGRVYQVLFPVEGSYENYISVGVEIA